MSHQVIPLRVYYLIFATLILLTLITVEVAFWNLGLLSFWVALVIASSKATLVVLYFMHVRYANQMVWLFAAAGFVFLLILIVLTLNDPITRGWQFQVSDPGMSLFMIR
jgi:cytochrome c oxidase subunit 4